MSPADRCATGAVCGSTLRNFICTEYMMMSGMPAASFPLALQVALGSLKVCMDPHQNQSVNSRVDGL